MMTNKNKPDLKAFNKMIQYKTVYFVKSIFYINVQILFK